MALTLTSNGVSSEAGEDDRVFLIRQAAMGIQSRVGIVS